MHSRSPRKKGEYTNIAYTEPHKGDQRSFSFGMPRFQIVKWTEHFDHFDAKTDKIWALGPTINETKPNILPQTDRISLKFILKQTLLKGRVVIERGEGKSAP